jgi:hypothetical protein
MNIDKIRLRIAGWFILLALKVSALFRPVPKVDGAATPKALRIEADVETTLSPGQIAMLLRNLARGNAHAPTLMALAEGIEGSRPANLGTRGTLLLEGEGITTDGGKIAGAIEGMIHRTRGLTREPGEILELQISVVVEDKSTTVDPFPVTTLSVQHTSQET